MGYATKSDRVSSLVEYYGKGNKSEFARLLGTTPQVIATWIARDTMNYDLIYAKCEGLSAHWLLSGEGDMLQAPVATAEYSGIGQLSDTIQSLCTALNERNKEIGDLRERIGAAEATITHLEEKLAQNVKHAGDVTLEESARAV